MTNTSDFINLTDLASEKLGGKTLLCSDDFFAPMDNLLKQGRGVFIEDKYTDHGKWMDGWESRRKRTSGHDWCIIQLATEGIIKGFDIDTNHFLGNHPPHASVEACNCKDDINAANWIEILPKSDLNPGSQHFFEISNTNSWTHVRLNIYPDGGVARFRVFGEVAKDWSGVTNEIDLASALNGARSLYCNDMFFSHMQNLLMPGKGVNMGDGWETKRNRTPNNIDWVIVKLATKGEINSLMIDTHNFKGNYPDKCSVFGGISEDSNPFSNLNDEIKWVEIIPPSKLSAHNEHVFSSEIMNKGPFTHIKLCIYPDGGISRLRIHGNPVA